METKSILKYFVEPTYSYGEIVPDWSKGCFGFGVFERHAGKIHCIAHFEGENAKDNAEIFAKAKLGGLKHFPNGFQSWMETHYQIASSIERAVDNPTPNVATSVRDDHGLCGLWELSDNLTDLFEEKHKDQYPTWDLDYFDTMEEFIENELFEAYSDDQ